LRGHHCHEQREVGGHGLGLATQGRAGKRCASGQHLDDVDLGMGKVFLAAHMIAADGLYSSTERSRIVYLAVLIAQFEVATVGGNDLGFE
jgi:hypothetical protein